MTPVNITVSQDTRAAVARVEAWCAAHRTLWDFWSDVWERATGHPLRLTDGHDDHGVTMVPIEGGGQSFATLASDARHPALEPWLRGIGGLIGEMLAADDELNGMTDELVDSYDQLTFLYEIARMLSTTSRSRMR
jgi:hypothetical protein